MSDDKRQFERKELTVQASFQFSSGRYEARISEIGLGGCYVDSIASVVEGEPISLTITSGGNSQEFDGEVAYLLPGFGFGVRFVNVTEGQTGFLRSIIG